MMQILDLLLVLHDSFRLFFFSPPDSFLCVVQTVNSIYLFSSFLILSYIMFSLLSIPSSEVYTTIFLNFIILVSREFEIDC